MKFKRLSNESRDKVAKIPNGWILKTFDIVRTRDKSGKVTGFVETVSTVTIVDISHEMKFN